MRYLWLWLVVLLCSGMVRAEVTLPQPMRPVIDLVETLDGPVLLKLNQQINQIQQSQGYQVRILVQKDESPGRKVKSYWNLGERSILVILNLKERNPLIFNVGAQVQTKLPRFFWRELQSRFGNQFYIAEQGRGQALIATVAAISESLEQGGRATVPGLSSEHWLLTFIASVVGGLVLGFACHPRRPGALWHWEGVMFSAPLWSILFVIFGLGVVLIRTPDPMPLLANSAGFVGAALVAFLIPTPKRAELEL